MSNTKARAEAIQFVRRELVWATDFVRKNYDIELGEVTKLIRETVKTYF